MFRDINFLHSLNIMFFYTNSQQEMRRESEKTYHRFDKKKKYSTIYSHLRWTVTLQPTPCINKFHGQDGAD